MIDREEAVCQLRRLSHMPGYSKDTYVIEDYTLMLMEHSQHETHVADAITAIQREPGARCPGIGTLLSILRSTATIAVSLCVACAGNRWVNAGEYLVTTTTDAQGRIRNAHEPITPEQTAALRTRLIVSRQMVYSAAQPCVCQSKTGVAK